MLCFDIGANVGEYSAENAHLYDKIIAVEPNPDIFKVLQMTADAYKNITPLNYAVCDNECKDIVFYKADLHVLSTINPDWLTSPDSRFYNTGHHQIICKTITIDKLIEIYGVPDLIKIDVEAGEYECVKSLSQYVKMLCFEWASEMNTITLKCIDHLYSLGFTLFHIQFEDHNTYQPDQNDFYDIDELKRRLSLTTPKQEWGMIWCK